MRKRKTLPRKFPLAFKKVAIAAALVPGVNKAAVAREFGIHPKLLAKWTKASIGPSQTTA